MNNMLRSLLLVTGLAASMAATAAGAGYNDYAIVSCKATTLSVVAFSSSYESAANTSGSCAATLKALATENMHLGSTNTTDSTIIVYTLIYLGNQNEDK